MTDQAVSPIPIARPLATTTASALARNLGLIWLLRESTNTVPEVLSKSRTGGLA